MNALFVALLLSQAAPPPTPAGQFPVNGGSGQVVSGYDTTGWQHPIAVTANGSVSVTPGSNPFYPTTATLRSPDNGGAYGTVLADFNNDGILDLAVVDSGANDVYVFLGIGSGRKGSGTFSATPSATLITGNGARLGAAADFNNDGCQDLAVTNKTDGTVSAWLGKCNGTFYAGCAVLPDAGAVGQVLTGVSANQGIVAGSFGSNNVPSIVVMGYSSAVAGIIVGDGGGCFSAISAITTIPAGSGSIQAADLNGDGYLDLIIAGKDSNLALLFGTSTQTSFSAATNYTESTSGGSGCAVGYFNADAVPDVACSVTTAIDIWFGAVTSGNAYTLGNEEIVPLNNAGSSYGLLTGDFTGDGLPDLATAVDDSGNLYDGVQILSNMGQGVFAANILLSLPALPTPLNLTSIHHNATLLFGQSGDMNGDGVPDLLAGNFYGAPGVPAVYSWLSTAPVHTAPASAGTQAAAVVPGQTFSCNVNGSATAQCEAPPVGQSIYVQSVALSNSTVASSLSLVTGTATGLCDGGTYGPYYMGVNGSDNLSFAPPMKLPAADSLCCATAGSTPFTCTIQGYVAP